jgi:L-lactate dehydrogenase complex protein LldG
VSAREEVLAAVRSALGASAVAAEPPRRYRVAGSLAAPGSPEIVEVLCKRVGDYNATVHRAADAEELESALAAACSERGSTRVLRAPGVDWTIPGAEIAPDSPALAASDLDAVDAALTGCALAIAETGTIVLDGGAVCGRRALTLVPDHHICVVRADQVVANVPDAIERLSEAARQGHPITFISGPSATSDIELERVEGVHGPRKLDVVVVG